MSCKFNSELLVAAFWTDHPKGIPPLRFWIFPRRISLPPIFPWVGNPFPPGGYPNSPREKQAPRANSSGDEMLVCRIYFLFRTAESAIRL